jgi:nucleoside-diphosphate kinase
MKNLTFSIIKPDAVSNKKSGEINALIERNGFRIVAQKMIWMNERIAKKFYSVHSERSFFPDLIKFMTSGPVIVQVLEKEDAINSYRELMGATNPEEAKNGTIRKLFACDIEKNAVHGSDSEENAKIEIAQFFSEMEIYII